MDLTASVSGGAPEAALSEPTVAPTRADAQPASVAELADVPAASVEPALTGEVPLPPQLAAESLAATQGLPTNPTPAPAEAAAPSMNETATTQGAPAVTDHYTTKPVAALAPAPSPALRAAEPAAGASPAPPPAVPAESTSDAPRENLYQITFTLQPDGYTHTRAFEPNLTLGNVAAALDADLHIPAQSLAFVFKGRQLPHASRLADHGLVLGGAVNAITMSVQVGAQKPTGSGVGGSSGGTQPRDSALVSDYVMPDVITVEVDVGKDQPPRVIHVPVERDLPLRGKPFLGGFRHKQSGLEYHHASVQSLPPPKVHDPNAPEQTARFHRDTQTAVVITRSQQAVREQGTQMTKLGVSVLDDRHPPSLAAASVGSGGGGADGQGDRYLVPMPYFSADDYDLLKLEKAIDIQRYTRGFFARCRAAELIALAARREEELRQAEEARRAEAEAIHRREVERRMNPRTYDDFETLFNELEAWRLSETAKINDPANGMEPHERSAALAQLVLREQKLLQTIDRLRGQAAEVNRDRKVRGALSRMAAPKRWQLSDGELVEVHTPYTTRAKELHELYNGLRLPLLSVDERLDVLLHVKWTVKEFDCNLTRDIVELIDREADMLNRGRSEASLDGLRKRLCNLFLQFVHTPEFNPEAARFQQVPLELTMLQAAMGGSGIAT